MCSFRNIVLCSKETRRVTVLGRNMLVFLECVLIWCYIFLSNSEFSVSDFESVSSITAPEMTSSFFVAFYYIILIVKVEDVLMCISSTNLTALSAICVQLWLLLNIIYNPGLLLPFFLFLSKFRGMLSHKTYTIN